MRPGRTSSAAPAAPGRPPSARSALRVVVRPDGCRPGPLQCEDAYGLLRQLYRTGSLRNEADGFVLEGLARSRTGRSCASGGSTWTAEAIAPEDVTARRAGDDTVHRALDVSPATPVTFRRGDVVTFHVAGWRLEPGKHRLELEVDERNLGRVSLAIDDRVDAPPATLADER
ncbi:MAG: hypothetical protein R3C32_14395 [Chloroflexota bacterium]